MPDNPFNLACEAVPALYACNETSGDALSVLKSLPESEVRRACKWIGRAVPYLLELEWVSRKVAAELMKGHRVTVFKPSDVGRPFLFTVATKD